MTSLFSIFSFLVFMNPAKADTGMNLNGTWGIDVDSSVNRCIRLQLSDCTDSRDAEAMRGIMKKRLVEKGDITFTFNNGAIESNFGEETQSGTYSILNSSFSFSILELTDSKTQKKETLYLFLEAPGVFCFGETAKTADSMCWRKK